MSSWFQSSLITLQAPALFVQSQTDNIIKYSEEAATRSQDRGDWGGRGLICWWSAPQQLILPWSPSVDSPIKTQSWECKAVPQSECICAMVTASASRSFAQTHAEMQKPAVYHMHTHTHVHTAYLHTHRLTHKHPQLPAAAQHIIPLWCSQTAFPSLPVTLRWLLDSVLIWRKFLALFCLFLSAS